LKQLSLQHEKRIWKVALRHSKLYKKRKEMNTMNPFVIYAMVAIIIAAGFLFIKYTDWKDKHVISE
jgi:hypothetical protein